jgi:hypothetical protein
MNCRKPKGGEHPSTENQRQRDTLDGLRLKASSGSGFPFEYLKSVSDSGDQRRYRIGLLHSAERVGCFRPKFHVPIAVRRRKDASYAKIAVQLHGRVDAVPLAKQADIHQRKRWSGRKRHTYRLIGTGREAREREPFRQQSGLYVQRDQIIVFDD